MRRARPVLVAAPPAQAAAPTCTGTLVARTDVDGDARRDTVTITKLRGGDRPVHRLCVKTATGKVRSALDTAEWQFADEPVFYGAAGLDGNKGNELVLRAGYGAHAQVFHVYRWANGRLVRQNAPDSRQADWLIDAAAMMSKGYHFSTSRGVRYVVASSGAKAPSGDTFRVTQTRYRWAKGAWQRMGTSTVSLHPDSAAFMKTVGWQGVSLPMGY